MVVVGHGGKREGAGRPKASWTSWRNEAERPMFTGWRSFHITLRVTCAVGRLRQRENYHAIRKAMYTSYRRDDFRIVHISLEQNHLHLIVEAASSDALDRGMRGFMTSAARRLNATSGPDTGRRARLVRENGRVRVIGAERRGRRGQVFVSGYHVRPINSPWQARNAMRYVLNNFRHHGEVESIPCYGPWDVDYYSSGPSFPHWVEYRTSSQPFPTFAEYQPLPVKPPRTWFLAEGWRKYDPISLHDVPGNANTIRNWVKQHDLDSGGRADGLTSDEKAELAELRRDNRRLRGERDIPRKFAAWSAQEMNSTPPRRFKA